MYLKYNIKCDKMVNFFRKIFIKNYNDVGNAKVREAHGKMASIVGIISNIILFIFKLVIGIISSSVSIIADSINNLSDLISSGVTLFGFTLSGKPADKEHPYGHQRIEYITGLIVSIFVIIVGVTLCMTSLNKIINYTKEEINRNLVYISLVILGVSIIAKLWQSRFYLKVSKIINSVALEATSKDSRNDVLSTFIIFIGYIIYLFAGILPFSLDGVLGLVVSIFIVISGISLIKETTSPLIGVNESSSMKQILEDISKASIVLNYHDPMCHMYGPTKCYMTIHVGVDASLDFVDIHEQIDDLEKEIKAKYDVNLTVHMDPVRLNDETTEKMKEIITKIGFNIDSSFCIHDFRIAKKKEEDSILFDLVVPYNYRLKDEEIIKIYKESLKDKGYNYQLYIEVDHE